MSQMSSDPSGAGSIPPFINAGQKHSLSPSGINELRFVAADPLLLSFEPSSENASCKRSLTLTNNSQQRIAWRLRTNAPTRYVVAPANGFLTPSESVVVIVDLTDTSKYNRRHRFMVQAMEAKEGERDRKKVWNTDRAGKLAFLQCIRLFTEGPETAPTSGNGLASPANVASSSTTDSSTRSSSGSSVSSSSSIASSFSTSSANSSSHSVASSSSASSGVSNADVTERVDELTQKIRVSMDEKESVSQKMINVVNEVKKIEVELDRAGAVCKELNARLTQFLDQIKSLEAKCVDTENQLKPFKEGK